MHQSCKFGEIHQSSLLDIMFINFGTHVWINV